MVFSVCKVLPTRTGPHIDLVHCRLLVLYQPATLCPKCELYLQLSLPKMSLLQSLQPGLQQCPCGKPYSSKLAVSIEKSLMECRGRVRLGAGEMFGQDVTIQIKAEVVLGQERARWTQQEVAAPVRAVHRLGLGAAADLWHERVGQEASPGPVWVRLVCRGPPLKGLAPLWWSEPPLADCVIYYHSGPPALNSNPSFKPRKPKAILKFPLSSGASLQGCLCSLGYLCLPAPASPGSLFFTLNRPL